MNCKKCGIPMEQMRRTVIRPFVLYPRVYVTEKCAKCGETHRYRDRGD